MATEREDGEVVHESPNTVAQRFNEYKPVIEALYSHQGWTLERLRIYMKREHGFQATARMYKARFLTWGFPSKKVSRDDYKAMFEIGTFCNNSNQAVHFSVLSGYSHKIKTMAQVTKQAHRGTRVAAVVSPRTFTQTELVKALGKICSSRTRILKGQQEIARDLPAILELCSQSLTTLLAENARTTEPSMITTSGGLQSTAAGSTSTQTGYAQPHSVREGHTLMRDNSPKQSSRYDFEEALDVVLMPSFPGIASARLHHLDIGQQPLAVPTLIVPDRQKAAINRWYRPYYYHCFRKTNDKQQAIEFDHNLAMSELQKLLSMNSGNEYFFVLLNWMICILYFNCKTWELEEFLHESLTVVQSTLGQDSSFCIAFRYVVAWVQGDARDQDYWGSLLRKAQDAIGAQFGPGHPSLIVYQYLWAYHCWQQNDIQKALKVLNTCLTAANDLMGPNYLLTIQCLSTQARIFASNGQHDHAVQAAQEALSRFQYDSELLIPYKLDIMRVLASSLSWTGNLERAETLLREVVAGRVALLGLLVFGSSEHDTTHTWHAIDELMRVLESQGRREEAEQIYEKYKKQYYEEVAEQQND